MRPTPLPLGPGQESVWDYPRPPAVENVPLPVRVVFAGREVASTSRAKRVIETAGAPVYYVPEADVEASALRRSTGRQTFCEWKGAATYYDLVAGDRVSERAAWCYHKPTPPYAAIQDHYAFYAGRVDEAWLGDERATPQPGGFYGGWITRAIVGPVKGEPGSEGW